MGGIRKEKIKYMKLNEAKRIAKDAAICLKGQEENIHGTGYYTAKSLRVDEDTVLGVYINIRKYKDVTDDHLYYGVTSVAEIDGGDDICEYDEDFTYKCNQGELARMIQDIVNNGFSDEELLKMYKERTGIDPAAEVSENTAYTEPADTTIEVRDKGKFEVVQNRDEEYPGVDVEFVPRELAGQAHGTLPRIVFEYPENGELKLHIWGNPDSEDPSKTIIFDLNKFVRKSA